MGLQIRVLGAPTVDVDGAPLEVDTRKAVALLARLAVGEPRIARDVVAGMLWPDAPTDRARASLRRTLSALTSGLGGRWVRADRTDISLSGDDVTCDAVELRDAVASAAAHDHPAEQACPACRDVLARAAAAWRGEFMEGFALRDAPAFEDWLLLEAEALRRTAASALERLTLQHAAVGAHDDALAVAHAWVALDPLHEQAHRAVMRVAAAAGRRDEATRQFHECVAALDRELGVGPLPATVELHRAILEGAVAEHVPPGPVPSPSPVRPTAGLPSTVVPLVDRGDELDQLTAALGSGPSDAVLLAVEGEAGIGKTRLVEELVDRATTAGHRALAVRCNPGEQGVAAAPLVDLLREAVRVDPGLPSRLPADVLAEVGRLVPELAARGPAPADLDQPGARPRFLEGVTHALAAAVAGPRQGLVVVEDLHWADPTTVEVLGWLVRRPAHRGASLVGTWRTESVPHDHPLRQLARDRAGVHLHLDRLDVAGVAELVEAVRPEVSGLAPRLHEETEGIPFFVVQYLMTWDGSSDWQLPAPVRDLVLTRLQPISELARQALAAASVVGRAADVDTFVRVSGRSEDEVVEAVEELLALGLLREDVRGYDCSHTKIREVVHDTTSLARRRLLHRRAAEALLRGHRDDPGVAAPAAHHLLAAGRDEQAAEQFARAAGHARSVFANAEAAEHLETALALGHPDPARLHAELGDLHVLAGRYAEARSRYDTAAALTSHDGMRTEVEHRMAELCFRRGDWPSADRHLRQTLELLADDDVATRARVTADLALLALRRGEDGDAEEQVAAALALAGTLDDDPGTLAEALNVAGLVARHRGDAPGARDLLTRAAAAAEQLDDPTARVAALNNLALALGDDGEHDRALAAATEALELSRAHGDRHREAALHSNVADLLHALGRTDDAMVHLKESARLLADVDEPGDPEPEIWKLRDW